jgi:hypothetical protein
LEMGKKQEIIAAYGDTWNTRQRILYYARYMDKMTKDGRFPAPKDLENGLYFKTALVIVKDEN